MDVTINFWDNAVGLWQKHLFVEDVPVAGDLVYLHQYPFEVEDRGWNPDLDGVLLRLRHTTASRSFLTGDAPTNDLVQVLRENGYERL